MEQNRNRDMQLVHTLAHYIHEGGEYEWSVRSHLAVEELDVDPTNVVYRREAGATPPMPPCGRRAL